METSFKFELGQQVALSFSGENGKIVGRAEYATAEDSYLIRYCASDGRAVEQWWGESALLGL